jgi:transposase
MDELLTMSRGELTRLEVMQRLEAGRMKQAEAAESLGVSTRHIRRLLRAFHQQGERGLISKRRGKPSNNRLSVETGQQAIELTGKHYPDFGPTLAHEKLTKVHELKLSVESVRQIMIAQKW